MTGALHGQVAVITGGANGIGRATAIRFANEGADVVIGDLLTQGADTLVSEIEAAGRRAVVAELDASDKEANEALADLAISEFGRLDVLVTAAGISYGDYRSGDIERDVKRAMAQLDYLDNPALMFCDIELDDWRRVIDVNLTGTFLAMQACSRKMIESGNGGRIVTIASIAAKDPDAGPVPYTASKAGVWMLTKKASRVLAPAKIRVNSIGPGFIATNMTALIGHADEQRKTELLAKIPLGRVGNPDDIANAALFLVSDQSSYMTGEILHPDGGWFTG
jgi:NAD(P)-dependent dehydrogenase (short-subunit alcohol dehydrogenase family)